jgi:predicted RNase H-like nuclease (RuvC/YqgF family)
MALTNQLKTMLPWLCVVALVAGMLIVRSRSKESETALAELRQANQELRKTRVEEEDLKKIQAQVEELGRLRKENEELHRLRNEVRQLREEKQGAARAGQSGQPSSAQTKADASAPPQLQRQLQQLMAENERLRAENQQFQQIQVNAQANAVNGCINNLRIIEGAKDQWALENKKGVGDAMSAQDIQPYLKNNALPACPQGGAYTLNALGAQPTCSVPGHVLPQQ